MIDWYRSYCGDAPVPGDWTTRWNEDPMLLAVLLAATGIVLLLPAARRGAGLAAMAVLGVAFVSPLCALTTALFAARAVHHLLLFGIAAPLLAIAFPPARRVPVALALPLSTLLLWAWHVPGIYAAALGHVGLYWALQVALLGGGWAYWAAVRGASPAEAVGGIVGGAVQMGFLGAVLTFATRPLYAPHLATTWPFGIGPLADQQVAGVVMWVPAMVPYALAAAWCASRGWRMLGRSAAA